MQKQVKKITPRLLKLRNALMKISLFDASPAAINLKKNCHPILVMANYYCKFQKPPCFLVASRTAFSIKDCHPIF